MLAPPIAPRARARVIAAAACTVAIGGCALSADGPTTIRAADIAQRLQSRTGIALTAVRPPFVSPGLPELATTLSGGSAYESLTVFVFFQPDGVRRLLGSGARPSGMTVFTRSNVVVLYRTSPRARNRSAQVRQALDTVRAGA